MAIPIESSPAIRKVISDPKKRAKKYRALGYLTQGALGIEGSLRRTAVERAKEFYSSKQADLSRAEDYLTTAASFIDTHNELYGKEGPNWQQQYKIQFIDNYFKENGGTYNTMTPERRKEFNQKVEIDLENDLAAYEKLLGLAMRFDLKGETSAESKKLRADKFYSPFEKLVSKDTRSRISDASLLNKGLNLFGLGSEYSKDSPTREAIEEWSDNIYVSQTTWDDTKKEYNTARADNTLNRMFYNSSDTKLNIPDILNNFSKEKGIMLSKNLDNTLITETLKYSYGEEGKDRIEEPLAKFAKSLPRENWNAFVHDITTIASANYHRWKNSIGGRGIEIEGIEQKQFFLQEAIDYIEKDPDRIISGKPTDVLGILTEKFTGRRNTLYNPYTPQELGSIVMKDLIEPNVTQLFSSSEEYTLYKNSKNSPEYTSATSWIRQQDPRTVSEASQHEQTMQGLTTVFMTLEDKDTILSQAELIKIRKAVDTVDINSPIITHINNEIDLRLSTFDDSPTGKMQRSLERKNIHQQALDRKAVKDLKRRNIHQQQALVTGKDVIDTIQTDITSDIDIIDTPEKELELIKFLHPEVTATDIGDVKKGFRRDVKGDYRKEVAITIDNIMKDLKGLDNITTKELVDWIDSWGISNLEKLSNWVRTDITENEEIALNKAVDNRVVILKQEAQERKDKNPFNILNEEYWDSLGINIQNTAQLKKYFGNNLKEFKRLKEYEFDIIEYTADVSYPDVYMTDLPISPDASLNVDRTHSARVRTAVDEFNKIRKNYNPSDIKEAFIDFKNILGDTLEDYAEASLTSISELDKAIISGDINYKFMKAFNNFIISSKKLIKKNKTKHIPTPSGLAINTKRASLLSRTP